MPISQTEFIKICTDSTSVFMPADIFKKIWIDAFFSEKEIPQCLLPQTFQLNGKCKDDNDDNNNGGDEFFDDTTKSQVRVFQIAIKPENDSEKTETNPISNIFDQKFRLENAPALKKKRAHAKLSEDALFAKNRPISSATCFEHFSELSEVESTMKEALELLEQEKFDQSLAAIKLAIVLMSCITLFLLTFNCFFSLFSFFFLFFFY